ncbi:MAG: energy transducer TonB [Bacteroidota bacterium]
MDNNSFYNDQHLTQEEMVAYHYGRLSNQEMHRLESHLVDCALCNAALEGMKSINETDLQKHLINSKNRIGLKKKSGLSPKYWMAAAASIILIAVVSILITQLPLKDDLIAENINVNKEKSESVVEEAVEDSGLEAMDEDLSAIDTLSSPPTETQLAETSIRNQRDLQTSEFDEEDVMPVAVRQPEKQDIAENRVTLDNELITLGAVEEESEDTIQEVLIAEAREMEEAATEETVEARAKRFAAPTGAQPQITEDVETVATYTAPVPERGDKAFNRYLKRNLKYPVAASLNNIEGEVTVEFTVNTDGSVFGFSIKQSLGYGCDEEAIRLIREGPKWIPATRDGMPVSNKVSINIAFKQ